MCMPNDRFNLKWALCVIAIAGGLVASPLLAQGKKGGGGGGGKDSAPAYTILQLDDANGTLPLSSYQGVTDINDLGGIVGTVSLNGNYAAAHWQLGSSGTNLTLLPGSYSTAAGCNNLNEVVGTTYEFGGSYWPSPMHQPIAIGDPYRAIPSDINDAGIVCGFSRTGSGPSLVRLPTLWNVNATTNNELVLPMVSGYPHGSATKISETDENGNFLVLGALGILAGGNDLYVRWSVHLDPSGALTASPPDVYSDPSTSRIAVLGMNDLGETCGTFYDQSLKFKDKNWLPVGYVPMVWSPDGASSTLEVLPSTVLSPNITKAARDINNAGMLVGECYAYQSSRKLRSGMFATVWSSAQSNPVALESVSNSSPFSSLTKAIAVDASGIIVGTGIINSQTHGFVAISNP